MKLRKIFIFILTLCIIFTITAPAFAESFDVSDTTESLTSDEISEIIDDATDSLNVNEAIDVNRDCFSVDGDECSVEIPKDAKDGISYETNGVEILVGLPEEVQDADCVLDDGNIVYCDESSSVSCAVQTIEDIQDEYSLRAMVVIADASAPKSYDFSLNLPDGYSIIKGEDSQNPLEQEEGWLYVVNNNDIITDEETGATFPDSILAIEPAWAKDANGNNLKTEYVVSGSTITQIVYFDENSAFPIVADPAMSGYVYSKTNVSKYTKWSDWMRSSATADFTGTKGGSISVNQSYTFSGSVSGNISGIVTIGTGTSITNSSTMTWSIAKDKKCYVQCRAQYNVEEGTRVKKSMNSGKTISTNSYTVKQPRGRSYREFRVQYC